MSRAQPFLLGDGRGDGRGGGRGDGHGDRRGLCCRGRGHGDGRGRRGGDGRGDSPCRGGDNHGRRGGDGRGHRRDGRDNGADLICGRYGHRGGAHFHSRRCDGRVA